MGDKEMELFRVQYESLYRQFGQDEVPLGAVAKQLHRDPRSLTADRSFPIVMRGKRKMVNVVRLTEWMMG